MKRIKFNGYIMIFCIVMLILYVGMFVCIETINSKIDVKIDSIKKSIDSTIIYYKNF